MTVLTASASSNGVGYLPPELEMAAAVVVAALGDLGRRETRQETAGEIRGGGLEPWLLLLEAYPVVAERVRARVEAAVAMVPQGDEGLLTGAETGRFNAR